ncbi:MAG TPA: NADPH-dependent FMN reductase [Actinomycetota bacterium]
MSKPHIVGIGGTTRAGSSTEKALRFTLAVCEEEGATTTCLAGDVLAALPHYAPENPERAPEAQTLIAECRRADGIVIASPGYHGTISGLVKNALDYTEDMREDDPPYFAGRAIGCIATGAGWQGTVMTLDTIRSIAHALRGWPTPMGAAINSTLKVFGPGGELLDERVRFQLTQVAREVVSFASSARGTQA